MPKSFRGFRSFARNIFKVLFVLGVAVLPSSGVEKLTTLYAAREQKWIIANQFIEASFQLDGEGHLRVPSLKNKTSGYSWGAATVDSSSPVNLTVDGIPLDSNTPYAVVSSTMTGISAPARGRRLTLVLSTPIAPGQIRFEADIYADQPFIRYRTAFINSAAQTSVVTQADMLSWKFDDGLDDFRDFFVAQWRPGRMANFESYETDLSTSNQPVEMWTGASADHTAWRAIRNSHDEGLVAAWEFDGRTLAEAEHDRNTRTLRLDAQLMHLNHPVAPGDTFRIPDAFIGVFHGDWDEAGFRTQRFAENVLARPAPDPDKFPYVMFDTWGYDTAIDAATAYAAATRAASVGAEVFILDFGWARQIGDWHPDPKKFPDGLKPLSDYVHSLGMKFGLHLPLLEADADSPVLQEHPDWEAVNTTSHALYFGATSLCPSHKPARDWIISEVLRVIQEYGVDWVTQDGENMIKICESASHTHAEGDSNYSNSVDGLDRILDAVQSAMPAVVWENCEDGGSLQTFHMIQRYVTSVLSDCDDALTTRRGVHGGTYPFPPRYTERYMLPEPDNTYETRSNMFGGPFILMNRITNWSPATLAFVKREVAIYKTLRATIRDSRIFHLTEQPDGTFNDYIQAQNLNGDRSIVFVYGVEPRATVTFVQPRGLDPAAMYLVNFLQVPHSFYANGGELMQRGFPVVINPKTAEIVSIDRQ